MWKRHKAAFLCSATVFLDAAIYFSISVSFAGIWFNYRDTPLLYEDKLGQISSLLAINTPVAVFLLIHGQCERPQLRGALVAAASLMTLIIQFLFRRAGNINDISSFCVVWNASLNQPFDNRFIIKAVWAGLVVIFFTTLLLPKLFKNWEKRRKEAIKRYGYQGKRASSRIIGKCRSSLRCVWRPLTSHSTVAISSLSLYSLDTKSEICRYPSRGVWCLRLLL